MLFVCYPPCATCRRARDYLSAKGIDYTLRDIKLDRPTQAEIAAWQKTSNLPLKRFFNASGLKYKELNLKERLKEMPEEEQIALLASDGMLVKRPILVGEDFVLVGFRQAEWERALG